MDLEQKGIKTESGLELSYDKLILETCSMPVKPKWLKGRDLENVFTIPKNKVYLDQLVDTMKSLNVLYSIISERFQIEAFGEIIVGIGLLIYIVPQLSITFALYDLIVILLLILSGAVIYTSIKLFTATLAFWIKNSSSIMVIFYDIADFTKQPLSIYPKAFQFVLRHVIPFAFTSYFPSAYLLGLYDPLTITIQAVGVAFVSMFIAYRF